MTLSELDQYTQDIVRDYGNRKWNPTLIPQYINEGYIEFVRISHCLRKSDKITITPNVDTFSLPSDVLQVNRYEWDNSSIEVTTEMDMALRVSSFRTATGSSIQRIMQDNEGEGTIRIYPRIESSDDIGTLVTVVGTDDNDYYCIKDHTATTDDKPITGDNYPLYWKATGGTEEGDTWVVSTEYTEYLYLYLDYSYIPDELSELTDEPAIDSRYHRALAEYAVYRLQYQEVQSDGRPIMGNIHHDNFLRMVAAARGRTIKGFASYQRNRRSTFPRFV